jgi:hypothetical protein
VAAEELRVHPWSLGGFFYPDPSHMPICWREWALEVVSVKLSLRNAEMKALTG